MNINVLISGADVVLSLLFTGFVVKQYMDRRKMHQLMWAIAIALWTIGVAAELIATLTGYWTPPDYRAYYATGALLIPAWLGMGTLYLIMPRKWSDVVAVVLAVISVIGVLLILLWSIDPAQLRTTSGEFVPLKIFPFFPVQLILIILNTFGAGAFILGALWSAYRFTRPAKNTDGTPKSETPAEAGARTERAVATALIAVGGLIAAGAHSLGALGGIELFRISELLALIFIFVGFLMSTPAPKRAESAATPAAS